MPQANVVMHTRRVTPTTSIIDIQGDISAFAEQELMHAYSEANTPTTRTIILNFSGLEYMNSSGIGLIVTLLIRINRQKQRMLAFDNMSDRVVSGTTDWKMYSVVLDVPDDAKNIFLGVLLTGKGQTWADDLTFEVVDRNIAVTNKGSTDGIDDPDYAKRPKATIKRPINLGFEEGTVP